MERKNILGFCIVIFIIMTLVISVLYFRPIFKEYKENSIKEFDAKWKPICENLGGLYLESGLNHANNCYVNQSGVLVKTTIIEEEDKHYLRGDCYLISKKGESNG